MRKPRRRDCWALALFCLLFPHALAAQPPGAAPPPSLGQVLGTAFNTMGLPPAKGALQFRVDFTDLIEAAQKNMQLAIVLDGTDSMTPDIQSAVASLATVAGNLQAKGGEVEYALVVYRDTGSPSGPVSVPLPKFTADLPSLEQALASVKTEDGAPYFAERVDEGIRAALDLEWSTAQDVTRWIIVCGDAPPYNEALADPRLRRKYGNNDLIRRAADKQIAINGILCQAGFQSQDAQKQAELKTTVAKEGPAAVQFLSLLAQKTGGGFIDLSNPQVIEYFRQRAAKVREWELHTRIDAITRADIEQARRNGAAESAPLPDAPHDVSAASPPSIAVLPHLPFKVMTFDPRRPEVVAATELRYKLGLIPELLVKNPAEIAADVGRIAASGDSDRETVKQLARRLEVDYIIWGGLSQSAERTSLRSELFNGLDGRSVGAASAECDNSDRGGFTSLAGVVGARLLSAAFRVLEQTPGADPGLLATFGKLRSTPPLENEFYTPISRDSRAHRALFAGMEQLEQALVYRQGDAKSERPSKELLTTAKRQFETAVGYERRNPFAYLMLASCNFNLARVDASEAELGECRKALAQARACRDEATAEHIKLEIDADYALLVDRDYRAAIAAYEKLTNLREGGRTTFALRAHWMLAGVYLGDWGVKRFAPQVFDKRRAREHIIQILAHWKDSPEARHFWSFVGDGYDNPEIPLEQNRAFASTR